MNWFERLTGFRERDYVATQRLLEVMGRCWRSKVNGRLFAIGNLETPSLGELRQQARAVSNPVRGALSVTCTPLADVAHLHRDRGSENALFQVASQFNLLEMTGPEISPEDGVTRYDRDLTQGPACAMAAGAATIYRNYLVEVGGGRGQTQRRQIDCLADVGAALGNDAGSLWTMRNGYALCSERGLAVVEKKLSELSESQRDELRSLLRIGLHADVEVTAAPEPYHRVSQAFCSALPLAYISLPMRHATRFATLILEAAYEATLWAAVLNATRTSCRTTYLTQVGGGAFGNDHAWIYAAMQRAFKAVGEVALDIRLVSRGRPPDEFVRLESEYR